MELSFSFRLFSRDMEWSFQESLIMILIGSLFFKDQIIPYIRKKFGLEDKTLDGGKTLKEAAEYLVQHYNHDLTQAIDQFSEKMDRLIELEEKETERDSRSREAIIKFEAFLDEIKRTGIKCRK